MKKSIILFVAAVTFIAPEITAHAGKPVDENGMPFGNGFPSGYHYNLNILGKQGHFTCPPPEYVDGTQAYGNVIFIPRDQGNDSITILTESFPDSSSGRGDEAGNDLILLGLVDCSGTVTFSSDGITLNRTSARI
jgi:hypothetical protein